MDLDPYLTTNVLKVFAVTPDIRFHHVDITVVALVVVGVVGADIIAPGTVMGLCGVVPKVVLGFKSI